MVNRGEDKQKHAVFCYIAAELVLFASALFFQFHEDPAVTDIFVFSSVAVNAVTWFVLYFLQFRKKDSSGKEENGERLLSARLFPGAALLLTFIADLILVLLDIQYLTGVFLFCCVQIFYALYLHFHFMKNTSLWQPREYSIGSYFQKSRKTDLLIRLLMYIAVLSVSCLFTDSCPDILQALAMFSFTQLSISMLVSLRFAGKSHLLKDRLLAAGLFLFWCCDLCVGLRNLPVPLIVRDSAYALNWIFYLPSQVLIVLGTV